MVPLCKGRSEFSIQVWLLSLCSLETVLMFFHPVTSRMILRSKSSRRLTQARQDVTWGNLTPWRRWVSQNGDHQLPATTALILHHHHLLHLTVIYLLYESGRISMLVTNSLDSGFGLAPPFLLTELSACPIRSLALQNHPKAKYSSLSRGLIPAHQSVRVGTTHDQSGCTRPSLRDCYRRNLFNCIENTPLGDR